MYRLSSRQVLKYDWLRRVLCLLGWKVWPGRGKLIHLLGIVHTNRWEVLPRCCNQRHPYIVPSWNTFRNRKPS